VKEDKFTTFMLASKDKLQGELEGKWQYYVIGVVLAVVLVWAVIWYFDQQSARESQAAETFSQAMSKYQQGDDQVAILQFSQVLENYSGTDLAAKAAFLLGNLNLVVRNYDEAIRHYRLYLNEYSGTLLNRAAAYAGIAAAQEDQGQYVEAAASFLQAVDTYPESPLRPDYEVGAVRNYLAAGDLESAEAHLKILEEKYEGTDWASRATRMIAEKSQGN
jgi:TolA-binding protein